MKNLDKLKNSKDEGKKDPKQEEKKEEEDKLKTQEKKESLEEEKEQEEKDLIEIPQTVNNNKLKLSTGLEETLTLEEDFKKNSIEDSLRDVEAPKTKDIREDFYSTTSYGSKGENKEEKKYSNEARASSVTQHRPERITTNILEMKRDNQFITQVNNRIPSELDTYSINNEENHYDLSKVEMYSRDSQREQSRNRNPFLSEPDQEIKYK